VAKQECHDVSKEICAYYPEQSCHNRQVQDCYDERKQVCEPGQPKMDCKTRQVQRTCTPPQYWTPQGCVARAPAAPLPKVGGWKPEHKQKHTTPESYQEKPPTPYKGPDIAKLDPQPAPRAQPRAPDPPSRNEVEPPKPPDDRREKNVSPSGTTRGPTIDVEFQGRSWRIELDPVPIISGAGVGLLLCLLALWPKRKELSAEDLRRLGIECSGEPDEGAQAVTHLATPPTGPRITVRTSNGARRTGIVMG
jgi:hypothetical protein